MKFASLLYFSICISFLSELFCLPWRIFCPVTGRSPICVCDYQFSDEGPSEAIERLKEMLDIDAAEEDLETTQESMAEPTDSEAIHDSAGEPKMRIYTTVSY